MIRTQYLLGEHRELRVDPPNPRPTYARGEAASISGPQGVLRIVQPHANVLEATRRAIASSAAVTLPEDLT